MTSVAASLAARVAVASAPTARPGQKRRTAASKRIPRAGYESDIPDTRGQPGRFGDGGRNEQRDGGGGLILPGDDRFDEGMVKGIPSPNNPGGTNGFDPRTGTGGPGQLPGGYEAPPKPGSEKDPNAAFAPFRPPSAYLDEDPEGFLKEDNQMSFLRIRNRAGMWYQLAPILPKLMRSGFLPDDIFDETGLEPREQSLWQTWTSTRGSLISDERFPNEKLSYFDDEHNGAPCLSSLQYLTNEERPAASEFVADQQFDPEQTKELIRAYEIRRANNSQAKGFGSTPGEIMAFKMWRDVQEVQRYEGMERVSELVEKGKKYAESETAVTRLQALKDAWEMDLADGSDLMEGGLFAKAKADNAANIALVRLDPEELAFRPIPYLGPMESLSVEKVLAVQPVARTGVFNTFTPVGAKEWVAMPAWAALGSAKVPFAILVSNTGKLSGAGDLSQREEPATLVVDKANNTPAPGAYFLVARESSIQLAGGKGAVVIDVYPGRECMDIEKDGKGTVIGKVVLAVRAPGGQNDGMTTDFVA